MPFDDVDSEEVEDLFPKSKDEHSKMLATCERKFLSSESWRKNHQAKWERYYELAMSHAPERITGEWGSKVFVPLIFTTIQTILPRMVAQLPEPIVYPVGPEDGPHDEPGEIDPMTMMPTMHKVDPAGEMEELLQWSAEQSGLFMQLVMAFDSALMYGTGLLKVTPGKKAHKRRVSQDVMEPIMAPQPVIDPETGQPLVGPDQQPVMEDIEAGEQPTGQTKMVEEEVVLYVGPFAECVHIKSIYPDPLCTSFEDAEYVIHRSFKSKSWVDSRFASKFFRKPDDYIDDQELKQALEDPVQEDMSSVGLGGAVTEADRVEVWECWYRDGTVITTLNRKLIVRVVRNPFDHGEFPFIRIVDHLRPHEFYGDGEVAHLEGIQDLINALTNQRVDNVRLILDKVAVYDNQQVKDPRSLRRYPGATIGITPGDGKSLEDTLTWDEPSDVTNSSYNEVEFWKGIAEMVSGVSPYQTGTDGGAQNDTATGVALISEQGNTRFSMKLKMAELTGIQALYRQYGALIQQFMPDDFIMRIVGPDGVTTFKQVEPAAIYGAFDYDIQGESSAQTETVRKQTKMELFNTALASARPDGSPVFNIDAMAEDLLRAFSLKDIERYLAPAPVAPPMPGQPTNEAVPPGQAPPEALPPQNGNGQMQPQGGYPG